MQVETSNIYMQLVGTCIFGPSRGQWYENVLEHVVLRLFEIQLHLLQSGIVEFHAAEYQTTKTLPGVLFYLPVLPGCRTGASNSAVATSGPANSWVRAVAASS